MLDKIISALESMQEDMEEHGELQKARGVSSAIWLIEIMRDWADRKTENNSEKPNNSTISKMEQVEDEFKQFDREDLILLIECQKERIAELLAKDEPQTEREGE